MFSTYIQIMHLIDVNEKLPLNPVRQGWRGVGKDLFHAFLSHDDLPIMIRASLGLDQFFKDPDRKIGSEL
jgi:hypothetical protein